MKIAHIVYQSLPNISGSSIRTRDIVMSQKDIGLDPLVISSPFQNGLSDGNIDIINGIKHYRTYNNKPELLVKEGKRTLYKRMMKTFEIFTFYRKTRIIVQKENPDILHAHATFFCAITAILLSKRFKIPVCYEVRSLWEEREKRQATNRIKKIEPKIITYFETFSMKRVDKVIVINKNLRHEISLRKIYDIDLIPNAVNINLIKNRSKKKPNKNPIRFGYIGSLSPIEGLDLVAYVWKELENEGFNNDFHVYGDGIYFNELEGLVRRLNLKRFYLHGSIHSELIFKAFEKIDVIVNPRLKSKISDTVTPLKPLEAMAYKKLVIASDVNGMKELIQNKETGLLFKADSKHDLKKLILLIIEKGIDQQIIECAYNYVYKQKSWRSNALKYRIIYEKLLSP